jgi:hypothetical protein
MTLLVMTDQNKPTGRIVEDPNVETIRKFFDDRTKYLKLDKLSQAYIAGTFTEQEAKIYNVSLDRLQVMFEAYCQKPDFQPSPDLPERWWDWKELKKWYQGKPENVLRRYVGKTIKVGTGLGLLYAVCNFIFDRPAIERQKYFQAWEVINTASGQPGRGGRNEALEYLNQETQFWNWYTPECKHKNSDLNTLSNDCLVGIEITKANLKHINLEKANLRSSIFTATSFRNANLKKANFKYSEIEYAHFDEARLEDTIFEGVKAQGAVFTGANLRRASFKDAHLEGAVFTGAEVEGVNFAGAKFCKTTMSNGKVYNRDCPKTK